VVACVILAAVFAALMISWLTGWQQCEHKTTSEYTRSDVKVTIEGACHTMRLTDGLPAVGLLTAALFLAPNLIRRLPLDSSFQTPVGGVRRGPGAPIAGGLIADRFKEEERNYDEPQG
jgi:hypothetical protein